jgi:hypothetical protein
VRNPPLQHNYAANVALVVLALFPGLINTSAIGLLSPVIGSDLGVVPDAVGRLPLFNDAALAFGALPAADVVRFVDARRYFYVLLGVCAVTSLVSALATIFTVLIVTHILHGLAAGNLFIVMLPPLVTGFGGNRLGSSAGRGAGPGGRRIGRRAACLAHDLRGRGPYLAHHRRARVRNAGQA